MSLALYDTAPENTMIKLLFVVLVVDMRCTSLNVRAPITTLVSRSVH